MEDLVDKIVLFILKSRVETNRTSADRESVIDAQNITSLTEFIDKCKVYITTWSNQNDAVNQRMKELCIKSAEERGSDGCEELEMLLESIMKPFYEMFPVLTCLHLDDVDSVKDILFEHFAK